MHPPIVVCEGPGRLSFATRGPDGGWESRPLPVRGFWPCWASGGEVLAVSTLETGSREARATIELLDGDGDRLRTAHHAIPGAPPVIAPRVPHYVQWAPDGSTLSFVAPGTESLGLYLSDREGSYSSDRVGAGAPLFHAWSADGRFIALHAGAVLSLYDVTTRETTEVSQEAIGFRVPVFLGQELIYAIPSPPGVSLRAYPVGGPMDAEREIARFDGGVVLHALPDGISVAMTREPDSGSFHQLSIVDPNSGDPRPRVIARGPFVAAIWTHAGDRVALVVPTQMGDGRYSVQLRARDGTFLAATEGFVPSQDFRTYLGFFDQYAVSHHLWAPDGSGFLLMGRLPGDGIAWSFSDHQDDYVWYWGAAAASPLQRVSVGDAAFFPPPAVG